MKRRVVVGLSGGVDSAVTAALLKEQGYEVTGVHLRAWDGEEVALAERDSKLVASHLGIPFEVLDVKAEYKKRVIDYFFETYKQGLTPNPDILCNSEIKFGIFYDWAMKQGFDKVATGHYARVVGGGGNFAADRPRASAGPLWGLRIRSFEGTGPSFAKFPFIQRGRDKKKDQSYFLWKVNQERLENVLFPLGGMLKSEVRRKAREIGLPVADKPDSMGVCFVGDIDVRKLLKERLGEKEGEVVMRLRHISDQRPVTSDQRSVTSPKSRQGGRGPLRGDRRPATGDRRPATSDQIIGKHKGLWFYTIGQRGGFEIDKKKLKKLGLKPEKMKPLYVVGKDLEKNRLIVGEREECLTTQFSIFNFQFSIGKEILKWLVENGEVLVRIRNLGKLYSVFSIKPQIPPQAGGAPRINALGYSVFGGIVVATKEAIFGVAPGQSAVFYWRWNGEEGNEVIVGGGEVVV